jgi:transaldolase
VGVTSNPTIFQAAIASGDAYDDQIRELSKDHSDPREIFWLLAADDIRDACDVMRPIWDEGSGKDGWVSLEVDPGLAHDTETTKSEAIRLHGMVDRPNLYIKIPATEAGLQGIEDTIAAGIPVNVTLIFSLERYRKVAEAYIKGIKRFVDGGGDPSGKLASVASFFVSRVDSEADKRLDQIGGHDELKGTLAIANAKLAYRAYEEIFSTPEWKELEAKGATPQRCLWASTSTKNPAYRDVLYVEELVGPFTVNTMPLETIDATEDHAEIRGDTIREDVDGAQKTLDAFEAAGISYDDVVQVLEREGVDKFAKSFDDLIEGLESKLKLVAA